MAVLDTFDGFGHEMKGQDLAAAWNRIGKLAGTSHEDRLWLRRNPEALDPLLARTQGVLGRFSARPLATTAHAMAKIGSKTGWRPERGVWEALAEAAAPRLRDFKPQEVSNTAWAFATANHQAPALFDAVAKAASYLWLEGRTLVHLRAEQERPTHMPRGPAKHTGVGFLNPAMAPTRTRSVMLLADALEHNWLVKPGRPIRALDALCATGVRIRRWRNEIPAELQHRLRITANDLDEFALAWAKSSH